ncbi:helix-turn-helix domain-containing protein [Amycolatopsis sp. NPDC006131]|uniref:sigma-54-dependent Fis family transcriptional regulator n=1 Tax=Amycolatopsis sp. NPDC006131 TaxID=3156731 RepID=UPI0033A01FA8
MAYQIDTRDGLARLRRAREEFLTERRLPDDLPEWLSAAWRRSWFTGADVTRDHVPAVPVAPESQLVRAATPVLAGLAEDLSGLRAAVVLSDSHARIVGCWAGDEPMRAHLERIDTRPGADLSESTTGANGISHVLSTREPVLIGGPEHLFELYQDTVCAGAPVTDPITRRISGAIAVVCDLSAPLAVLDALARTASRTIERELLHAAPARERRLLETYLAAAPGREAVAVLDGRTRIVSDAAADLLSPQDLDTLESYAVEAARDGRAPSGELTLGDRLTVRLAPAAPGGLLVTVTAARPPRRRAGPGLFAAAGLAGSSPPWRSLERALTRARSRPVLLLGEPGVGKASVARALLGEPVVVEADEPVEAVAQALAGEAVLVRHLERLDPARAGRLADLLAGEHAAHVVATMVPGPALAPLRTRWAPAEIRVPSLRERTADIPELANRFGARLTHEARAVLQRHDWPGNLAELKAVISGAAAEAGGGTIGARHLPGRLRSSPTRPRLSELEKAERAAVAEALRTADGNRVRAAALLGIGRATLYRKLKRYGLG